MSEQHREILNRHWHMLKSYINPTDCLINRLVTEKVLPASMADDIRAGDGQAAKNDRLLKSLKIVGSAAFKKFRHVLLEQGHAFIAELLWDEDCSPFIEECDFNNYPSFKNSLNPMERKQLIWLLDSKVKSRLLQSEWRNNSEERIKKLKAKIHHDIHTTDELKNTIVRINADLSSKNESLKNMVKDYNILNDDVTKFENRHNSSSNMFMARTSSGCGDNRSNNKGHSMEMPEANTSTKDSRFHFIDTLVCDMDQRLSILLGDGEPKPFASIEELNEKTKRLKQLVRELEAKVDKHTGEENQVQDLLFPGEVEEANLTLVQNVHKFLSQEQEKRVALLEDVDRLSKKLRGITEEDYNSNSALKGLRQSAVTGNPSPEIVDFRFLRNHIALLLAEADHMTKKILWKDEELNALRADCEGTKFRVAKPSCGRRSKLIVVVVMVVVAILIAIPAAPNVY